jgi:hypothetical protein
LTKVYRGLGLACTYPENWQLSEETVAEHADQSTVVGFNLQSPTSAFMSVYRYPQSVSPDEAIEEATKAIAADYEGIELASFAPERELLHVELAPSQPKSNVPNASRGTDLNFYYLDLLITVRLISFQFSHYTFLLQFQAEDRDFTSMERVFQAMLITMMQSLQTSPEGTIAESSSDPNDQELNPFAIDLSQFNAHDETSDDDLG